MRKIIYMAVAAIAALSSCSSEDIAGSNGISGDAKVFTGTIDNDNLGSRSTLTSEKKVNWESTDEVSINGVTYTATPETDATTATFKKKTSTDADPTGTYMAVYPATMASGSGSEVTFTLPASYTYSESGKFNMPMYAESETTSLGFKNICGVLAVTVPANTSTMTVKSENQMNGAFTYDATNNKLTFATATVTTEQQTITVNYSSSDNTQVVYVPVPAGSYDCLVIEFGVKKKTVTRTVTVERSKIYSITFGDGNSVTTRGLAEATVSAGSSDKRYVAWVQLWSGGPKFATINVGQTVSDYSKITAVFDIYSLANVGGLYKWGGTNNFNVSSSFPDDDHKEGYESLTDQNDTATKLWGSAWRMPTQTEFNDLKNSENCECTWCDGSSPQYVSGCTLEGCKVSGKTGSDYANNSVFLPAAGSFDANGSRIDGQRFSGYYWSSTPWGSNDAYSLYFLGSNDLYVEGNECKFGRSVRAVLKD